MSIDLLKLTQKALSALDQKLDHPEEVPTKDLKDVAFGLLDRINGSRPSPEADSGFLASQSARGAVLGALEGLASIAGASFQREEVEQRMLRVVSVEDIPVVQRKQEERNPYEGLQKGPNGKASPPSGPVHQPQLPEPAPAVHRKRVSRAKKASTGG